MKDLTPLKVSLAHATQQGPRPRNEDFVGAATPEGEELAAKGVLLAVADGVGGHAHGREAAEQTVRSLLADYYATPQTWGVDKSIDTVLGAVNRWLLGQSAKSRDYAGMATTLTAVVLRGRRHHVGGPLVQSSGGRRRGSGGHGAQYTGKRAGRATGQALPSAR